MIVLIPLMVQKSRIHYLGCLKPVVNNGRFQLPTASTGEFTGFLNPSTRYGCLLLVPKIFKNRKKMDGLRSNYSDLTRPYPKMKGNFHYFKDIHP